MSDEEDGFVFNAAFTFDASDEEDDGANRRSFSRAAGKLQGAPRATPWDFGDAKREMREELRAKKMTSVDEKIARARAGGGGRGGGGTATTRATTSTGAIRRTRRYRERTWTTRKTMRA